MVYVEAHVGACPLQNDDYINKIFVCLMYTFRRWTRQDFFILWLVTKFTWWFDYVHDKINMEALTAKYDLYGFTLSF